MTHVMVLSRSNDALSLRFARGTITFVLAALAVAIPVFGAANVLLRPILPIFEPAYVWVHHAHSVVWYEQSAVRRTNTLRDCVAMAEAGRYSQDCVNVWAAEAEVGDHHRLTQLRFASDHDWEPQQTSQ